ncbi:MAG: acetyl-CoA C-acetyltransferase [Ostreibacterium sp.]
MTSIAIVAAKRSAIGRLSGAFSSLSSVELGQQVATAMLQSVDISPQQLDEIVTGQVLTAGCGQNPARQIGLAIGMRQNSISLSINQVCGSGLRSVILGMQSIICGQSEIVLAGGQESMSNAPHLQYLRSGVRYGNATLLDSIISDGLADAFDDELMGMTAERLANQYHISRKEQDRFALRSQQFAQIAIEKGYFDSQIADVVVKHRQSKVVVNRDEHPRFDSCLADIEKRQPAFKKEGTVTVANASGINDGAAYVLLMRQEKALSLGLSPLATISGFGLAGVDPKIMGYGPVPSTQKALSYAGWTSADLELIEVNEAFAAQVLAVCHGLQWDDSIREKINITGGAIALGHPIGASGTRILVTLLYNMQRLNVNKGLATLCGGGGQGVSLCLQR